MSTMTQGQVDMALRRVLSTCMNFEGGSMSMAEANDLTFLVMRLDDAMRGLGPIPTRWKTQGQEPADGVSECSGD